MTGDPLDHVLRHRTRNATWIRDRMIALHAVLLVFCALVYLELAWARAIDWWLQIGCSVHSLPALFVESLGVGNLDHFSVAKVALAMLIAAMVVLTDKMETRR